MLKSSYSSKALPPRKDTNLAYAEQYKQHQYKVPAFLTGRIFQIDGHLRKKIPKPQSKEIKKFFNVKRKEMPDSVRVIIPSKAPIEYRSNKLRRNNSHFNENSKEFNYISKVDYKVRKRPVSSSIRETYDFNNRYGSENYSTNSEQRHNRNTPYGSYSTTSQILNLPGAIKRNESDIIDDAIELRESEQKIRNRVSYKAKIANDFRTNISCLPGGAKNIEYGRMRKSQSQNGIRNVCLMNESDIFNLKNGPLNKEQGHIKISKKRIFPEKNNITSPQSTFAKFRK